jgi:hypothetical protein
VLDPNGNTYVVGTATSDSDGFYTCSFVPPVSGTYKVIATFAGSKAYWGSHDATAIVVGEAAATATPMPTPAPTAADLYFVPAVVAIIVAILLVGVVIILVLKKRP